MCHPKKSLSLPNMKWYKNIPTTIWLILFIMEDHNQLESPWFQPILSGNLNFSSTLPRSQNDWCYLAQIFLGICFLRDAYFNSKERQNRLWGRDGVAEPNGDHFWNPTTFLPLMKMMM